MPPQSPQPEALRKKSENQRRNFRLECIANRYARRRLNSVDYSEDMPGDKVRGRRAVHVALSDFPSPRDFCVVTGIRLCALDHTLVKFGPNVRRLKIHHVHAGITELELN